MTKQQFKCLSRDERKKAIALMEEDIRKSWEPKIKEDHFMYCDECFEIAEKLPIECGHNTGIPTHRPCACTKGGGLIWYVDPEKDHIYPHGMLISEYNALPESEKPTAIALMKQDIIDWETSPIIAQGKVFAEQNAARTFGYTAAFKCPSCGSHHTDRISPASQLASLAVFGIFSKRINQDYVCRDCGYKW